MSPKDPQLAHCIQSTLYDNIAILVRGEREWIFDKLHRQSGFPFDPTLCLCFNELFRYRTQRKRQRFVLQRLTVPYVWSRKSSME